MPVALMVIQIVISIALILVVILQVRKSSRASGIFGGGTTADYGGKKGREAFLMKLTTVVAVLFMLSSLLLSLIK
ncbi:MAG: preprotein translocase subunit SecG [Candidatus Caldatribacteriota bacterium]|jgi:preprotein translocase subunit SecG|nr:preprotein translocase subunit SecG [Candidatus Caldatribacteriota bacterium]